MKMKRIKNKGVEEMILKKSKINPITVFCYLLILVNFIGVI